MNLLIVADNIDTLEALGQTLSAQKKPWKLRFAQSAADALTRLEREPADAVISEIRMADMDGAQLLAQVRERYPKSIRIALCNAHDREGMARGLGIAHQMLTLPVDAALLSSTLARASLLQARIHSAAVIQALGSIDSLPVLPRLYWDLSREIDRDSATAASVCPIIEQDVGMTARLLQVVNSAMFTLQRRIGHVRDAIAYLGFEPVRSLVLTSGLCRAMSGLCAPQGFSLDAIQQHSMRAARIAMGLVRDVPVRKLAFSAAMLHDIGRIVIALGLPADYGRVQGLVQERQLCTLDAEREIFGCTHAEIGAHLLALWGLPNALVEAVAFHHEPQSLPEARLSVAGVVHVANWIEHQLPDTAFAASQSLDREYLARVGLLQELPDWQQQAQQRLAA